MKKTFLLVLAACAALPLCQTGRADQAGEAGQAVQPDQADKPDHAACATMPPYQGSPAFERMKSLLGKWSAESPEMGRMNTEFRLIAGEAVIEERFAEGTPMEMLSTYYDVEGKLVMTHYCMLRNQPHMKLTKITENSLTFDLAPTPGLDPAKDKHMHGATYTFLDKDHFRLEGVAWENGKPTPCGPPVIFTRQQPDQPPAP